MRVLSQTPNPEQYLIALFNHVLCPVEFKKHQCAVRVSVLIVVDAYRLFVELAALLKVAPLKLKVGLLLLTIR